VLGRALLPAAGMADVGRAAGDRVESARGDRPPSHAASVFGGRVMPKLALHRKARQRSSFRGTDSDYSRSGPWPLDYSRSGPSLITLGLAPGPLAPLWPLFGTSVWPLAPRSALGLGAAPPSVPAITLGLAAGLAARDEDYSGSGTRLLWVWYDEITLGLVRGSRVWYDDEVGRYDGWATMAREARPALSWPPARGSPPPSDLSRAPCRLRRAAPISARRRPRRPS